MSRPIVAYLGSTDSWTITLKNRQGVVLLDFYDGTEPLTASVWAGKDQAPILVPTVAWDDAAAATATMTITAAQLAVAGVTGLYRVDVWVTKDGEPSLGASAPLQIEDAPGSAAVLSTYATAADLTGVAPGIDAFQSPRNDLAGFLAQRHEARVTFEALVTNRYRPQPGRSRRMLNAARTAVGPYPVFGGEDEAPTVAEIRTWFSTSRLLVTEEIRLWNAYLAAALVYEDQIVVNPQGANTYAALAKLYRDHAEAQWNRLVVEFDSTVTVPAASPTHRIDRDVTFLT